MDAHDLPPLSVVYITLNAERLLRESLAAACQLADDVVVVDAGSTDATTAIIRESPARLLFREWTGFAEQKQYAVDQARHDWVLILDADEVVPPDTVAAIRDTIRAPRAAAYRLPRKNYFQGRWIRHGSWWPDRVVRLVDRSRGRFSADLVHERWLAEGPVGDLISPLCHYSYAGYGELIAKMNRYSDLGAHQLAERGRRVGRWAPLWHGGAAFCKSYLWQRGFLDGVEGLAIALTIGLGSFLKYAKAGELQRRGGRVREVCSER